MILLPESIIIVTKFVTRIIYSFSFCKRQMQCIRNNKDVDDVATKYLSRHSQPDHGAGRSCRNSYIQVFHFGTQVDLYKWRPCQDYNHFLSTKKIITKKKSVINESSRNSLFNEYKIRNYTYQGIICYIVIVTNKRMNKDG